MELKYVSPTPSFISGIVTDYKNGFSPIILVCGETRKSKTTKAFIFANWISGLLFKKSWEWNPNTIINIDQLILELNSSDEGRIYVMDEVQRQLSKKLWAKPESMLFSLLMGSQAYKHFIIFLILPKAWDLGSDHATSVNYVCPVHSKTFVYPYHVESNFWDISLLKKVPKKFPLSYFYLDIYNKATFGAAFKEELGEPIDIEKVQPNGKVEIEHTFKNLNDFKTFININLKEVIMAEAMEKRGLNKQKELVKQTTDDDAFYDYYRKNPVHIREY